jgi:hypothetical protein
VPAEWLDQASCFLGRNGALHPRAATMRHERERFDFNSCVAQLFCCLCFPQFHWGAMVGNPIRGYECREDIVSHDINAMLFL